MKRRRTIEPAEVPQAETQTAAPDPSETDVFVLMRQINPSDWEHMKVYIHRVWPVIDRRQNEHFIAKVSEPIDEDYLLTNFGTGKYTIRLNDAKGNTVGYKTVSVHNQNFRPKVSPDEVVASDPRNETYFKVWGRKETTTDPGTTTAAGTVPPENAAMQELTKLVGKLVDQRDAPGADATSAAATEKLIDWALKQKDKEAEASNPAGIAALLRELKAVMAPAQQPVQADPMAALSKAAEVLKSLERPPAPAPDFAQLIALAEKLNPTRAKTEADDPIATLERILNIADRIRPQQQESSTAAAPESEWARIITAFQPSLTALITNFPQIVTGFKHAIGQNGTGVRQQPTGTRPAAHTEVPPTTEPNQMQAAASAGLQPDPSVAAAGIRQPTPEEQQLQQQVASVLQQVTPTMLFHFNNHLSGADFAAHTLESGLLLNGVMVSGDVALQIARQIGKSNLVDFFRSNPALWAQLAPTPEAEARFIEFVEEFLTYEPQEHEEEDEEESHATK